MTSILLSFETLSDPFQSNLKSESKHFELEIESSVKLNIYLQRKDTDLHNKISRIYLGGHFELLTAFRIGH